MLGVFGGQKRASDCTVCGLEMVMSHHIGVVGTELRSSVQAMNAPKPDPFLQLHLLKYFMQARILFLLSFWHIIHFNHSFSGTMFSPWGL